MRYGLIGNCKTAALVHETGSVDWACFPNFDSPSAFARILDPKGGCFKVSMAGFTQTSQQYLPHTNILSTRFESGDDGFEVLDFMPRHRENETYLHPVEIHRILRPIKGEPVLEVTFDPRLNYARDETRLSLENGFILAQNNVEHLYLYSSLDLRAIFERRPVRLAKEEFLLLAYHEKIGAPNLAGSLDALAKTQNYWEGWSSRCNLPKIAPNECLRSALALKLMTFEPTGAIVAATTTSLPEIAGFNRNWDYRFCWLRDASLMLEALTSIGHFKEAKAFIHFLLNTFESKQTRIQILYGIDGRTNLHEETLDHLAGYKNSRPVRIGNQAALQRQNDIYGEMINALYLYFFHYRIEKMTDDVWSLIKFLATLAKREWQTPDAGIWEYRNRLAHFTFSKILSWVALDRASKIAREVGNASLAVDWGETAAKIKKEVLEKGFNPKIGAFTQAYECPDLDVGTLLMEHYGFLGAKDPYWISTVHQHTEQLIRNGYGFRYIADDDFGAPQTSFTLATFWIAKALYSIGEKSKARQLFDRALEAANHVGLLSEDVDIQTGELLGNFPQAYSHMAVINTAHLLSRG